MILYFVFYRKDKKEEKFLSFFKVSEHALISKLKDLKLHNCMMQFVDKKLPEMSAEEYSNYKNFFKVIFGIKIIKSLSDDIYKYKIIKSEKDNLEKLDLLELI